MRLLARLLILLFALTACDPGGIGVKKGAVAVQVAMDAKLASQADGLVKKIVLSAEGTGNPKQTKVFSEPALQGGVTGTIGGLNPGQVKVKAEAFDKADASVGSDEKTVAVTEGATLSVELTIVLEANLEDKQDVAFPKAATVSVKVTVKPGAPYVFKSLAVPGTHPRITATGNSIWVGTQVPSLAHRIESDFSTVSASFQLPVLPSAIAADYAGNFYFSGNGGIWRLETATSEVASVSTYTSNSLAADGTNNFWYTESFSGGKIVKLSVDGQSAGQFPPGDSPREIVLGDSAVWAIVGEGLGAKVASWDYSGTAGPAVGITCGDNCKRIPYLLTKAPGGAVWAALDNGNFARISATGQVELQFDGKTSPSSMVCDKQGILWTVSPYGVERFKADGTKLDSSALPVTAIGGPQMAITQDDGVFIVMNQQFGGDKSYFAKVVPVE